MYTFLFAGCSQSE